MDYLPGQYGMHYERIGLNDYHYDSLGLTGHRPYYAFSANQLATGEQSSNGHYTWMNQSHSGQHLIGQKQYELTNHLGNVQVTVSDLPYKLGNDTIARISPALKAVYDYYPFGSPMPGRTIMDTARKCVDMTRLDRVWKAWEMTQTEIYTLSLINYHLDGEGQVFIDDNGAVEVEIADEYAVFYMDLQDSLNNGGEMVLHVDWLKEFSEKGFLLTLQGMDATGEMRVFYQKHYEKPEDALYLNIADSFTNVSVGIQGALHFGISNIRYYGGSWVNEEVLVRVCDEEGDRYRFGFNGMLKDNEWAGMGTHLDFGARIYDSRSGRWLSVDPLAEENNFESPYVFVHNNPLIYVDPDGRDAKVVIKGNRMTISTTIYVYGSGATKANAALMQKNIMDAWSTDANGNNWQYTDAETGSTYDIVFDIKVQQYDASNPSAKPGFFSGKNNPFNTDNYIEIDNNSNRSFVRGGDEGVWRGQGRNGMSLAQDDSAPHEFGHILGLRDQYTNSNGSNSGWQGNIMAEPAMQGVVEQKNINEIAEPLINQYNKSVTKAINDKLGKNIKYETKIDP